MHAHTGQCAASRVHGKRHVEKWIDVGHAYQAKAHALAADRVYAVVVSALVQTGGALQREMGKGLVALALVQRGPFCGQRLDTCHAPRVRFRKLGNAFLHEGFVVILKVGRGGAVFCHLLKLVHP